MFENISLQTNTSFKISSLFSFSTVRPSFPFLYGLVAKKLLLVIQSYSCIKKTPFSLFVNQFEAAAEVHAVFFHSASNYIRAYAKLSLCLSF